MKLGTIDEVGLDPEQRLFICPASGDFEQIYRAAAEVGWYKETRRLSHPRPPRGWTPVQWYQHIVSVVAVSLKKELRLTDKTAWTAIPDDIKVAIEAAARASNTYPTIMEN